MIPSTLTLLVAATSSVLSVNALPVLSGFFARNTPASLARRDLTSAQLAQGSNEFFKSLRLEDLCTPGQVGCINNNTATCSGEGNWEITPCTGNATCLAFPVSNDNSTSTSSSSSNSTVLVTCTDPSTALAAIEQAGGAPQLDVNFNVTAAPFNATVNGTFSPIPDATSSTDSSSDVPTSTDSSSDVPTSTDLSSDVPTPTDGSTPTGTDASNDPNATCTEDPSAEPTETEYVTVIAFPDPTNSSEFSYSTLEPLSDATPTDSGDLPDPTDSIPANATTTDDGSYPTDSSSPDANAPTPTDSGNSTTPCVSPDPQVTPSDTPTDNTTTTTDTTTDGTADPTSTDVGNSITPTTLSVPPNFSMASGPVPDISTLGTFVIPAPTTTGAPARRRLQRKVRRS